VDPNFEVVLKSLCPLPVPKNTLICTQSILSSKLNGGVFCCLVYFLIFLEKVSFTKLCGSNFELSLLSDRYGLESTIDTTEFELKATSIPEPLQRPSEFTSASALERFSIELFNNVFLPSSCSRSFLFRRKFSRICNSGGCVLKSVYQDHILLSVDYPDDDSSASPRSISELIRYVS
jgi:hypothetical protein